MFFGLGHEPLRPPHPKFKPAHFVRVSCRKFKIVVNLDFLGCQHWNEQLRFFKILEYTGRYGFPEILIEVRAAFLELTSKKCSPNVRRMFAKSEEKTSHRFGIVVLKTEISVSRPIENSGVEWVSLRMYQNNMKMVLDRYTALQEGFGVKMRHM